MIFLFVPTLCVFHGTQYIKAAVFDFKCSTQTDRLYSEWHTVYNRPWNWSALARKSDENIQINSHYSKQVKSWWIRKCIPFYWNEWETFSWFFERLYRKKSFESSKNDIIRLRSIWKWSVSNRSHGLNITERTEWKARRAIVDDVARKIWRF